MRKSQPDLRYFTFTALLIMGVEILFFISRWLFYLLNPDLFSLTAWETAKALFAGVRFDLSAILYLNIPVILLLLVPLKARNHRIFRNITKWIFVTINSIALFANFADIVYYRFTLKRTTADVFSYFYVGGDFDKLIPLFIKDFWYIAILWILIIFVLIKAYHFIETKRLIKHDTYTTSSYVIQGLILVFAISLSIIGMRGGLQLRPINIITAGNYAQGNTNAIVLNTPFTILQTLGKDELKPTPYFDESQLTAIYSPYRRNLTNNRIPSGLCNKKNIVLIIVESLSMEHIGFFNKGIPNFRGFTPFIDSLAQKSLTFQGISNGKRSIEGIPAILSGIPTLMNTPFISSPYSGNSFTSLPEILNKEGYHTAFFHGGTNGTMGFDTYCKTAGFEQYFGKNEYPNKSDDDGSWGIWDEPYLQYFENQISTFKEPFFASIFTLSSHHPFKVPQKFEGKFPKGKLPIQETIAYADYCIAQFFATASRSKWYTNTLFIITADHTSEANLPKYSSDYGLYRIPIIIYDPTQDLSQYSDQKPAQQIDIMPTILSYLNYKAPVFCFGKNLLDTTEERFAINYKQPDYQIMDQQYMLKFNGETATALYNIIEDKTLSKNLISLNSEDKKRLETHLKAFIQQYNHALIYNKMR